MNATDLKPYSPALVRLFTNGIIEKNHQEWDNLLRYQYEIQEYIQVMGLELIIKKDEGFAYTKQIVFDDGTTMGIAKRRQYGFEVSVMLIVLRQMLEDFDNDPTESHSTDKYVMAREIKEEMKIFLPNTFNQAKQDTDLDRYINDVVKFGFLVESTLPDEADRRYRIHRIIKEKISLDDLLAFRNELIEEDHESI